jgi:hypothetical protein
MYRNHYPLTPISHLPGSGPYALDSYRIYCGDPDAWRTVMPRDKELVRYIVRLDPILMYGTDGPPDIIEVALGYSWQAMVACGWRDGPSKRDIHRAAHLRAGRE